MPPVHRKASAPKPERKPRRRAVAVESAAVREELVQSPRSDVEQFLQNIQSAYPCELG